LCCKTTVNANSIREKHLDSFLCSSALSYQNSNSYKPVTCSSLSNTRRFSDNNRIQRKKHTLTRHNALSSIVDTFAVLQAP
jgi:hypothetical protein